MGNHENVSSERIVPNWIAIQYFSNYLKENILFNYC